MHFLVRCVTGTAVSVCSVLHTNRLPYEACFGSNTYLVDCISIRSMQPFCPSIACCNHSCYSTQFAACPASVKSRISFSSLPLTLANFISEDGAACQHLPWDTWGVTAWAPHWHAADQERAGGCFSQPSVRQPDQIPLDTKRAFLE